MSTLDIDRIRRELPGRSILYYATVDSTMRAAAGCEPGTVVLAEEQTAGQGRHGRSWHSEAGSGIYCSVVLEPKPALTLALGLATADAIARATGLACDLRWPNDVMLGGKKVAGILVQLADGNAIGGIGINVNHASFPPELASEATSLRLETGAPACATGILLALLPAIDTFVEMDGDTILRRFARASSYAAGRRVTVEQPEGTIEGTTAGLDPAGFLIVRKDDGTDTLIVAGGVRAAGS
ncbi:MAG: biotin--[acetyl-CoA-carboxylase] ligase [Bryobacteraceae bacterium]|jgi:BirA family biotin operon repressor/biotin-[acetyl-CoA-carboxylase] ligase